MWEMIKGIFNLLFAYKNECNKGKNPFLCKTIWTNVFAVVGAALAKYLDIHLTTEDTVAFLAVVNIILRLVTKHPTGFYELEAEKE
jgi:hypothetical protein